jgi:predicted aspartyl protease
MNPILPALYLRGVLLTSLSLAPASVPDPGLPSTTPDLLFASPTRIDHIGRIVAPVMIDGKGPFRFIIDTGASSSGISPQLALTLGLDSAQQATMVVNGITGTEQVPSVRIDRLEAGDLVIEDTRFPVIWAPLMAGADGILGVAGLRKESVFVDFRRNRVAISRSMRMSDRAGLDKVSAKTLGDGLLSVEGQIDGVTVQAIIDTGSERTLGNPALRDALYAQHRRQTAPLVTNVYGATPDIASGEIHQVSAITLGSMNMANVAVVFGDFHIFQVWGMQERPTVIVGMDILGTANSLGLDFRRSEIYFDAQEHERGLNLVRGVTGTRLSD